MDSMPYPTSDDILQCREDRKKYREAQRDLTGQWLDACLIKYALGDHPKKEQIRALAWDEGHSAGLYMVEMWVSTLAALILP